MLKPMIYIVLMNCLFSVSIMVGSISEKTTAVTIPAITRVGMAI